MTDNVNSPSHYKRFRFECEPKDFTKHLPHPLASAIEYYIRSPYKANELEDLQKAAWWICEFLVTDSFWESDFNNASESEISCRVSVSEGKDMFRYLAAAWALAATCDDKMIEDLFYLGDPLKISKLGVERLLVELNTRINDLQGQNSVGIARFCTKDPAVTKKLTKEL